MSQSEIAGVNRMFEEAVRKADVDRLASLYTTDAVVLPPDGPFVKGRDGIKQLWASVVRDMGLKDVKLQTIDLETAGETAYEMGEAVLTLESGTATVKYVVVWKKAGGQWRLHRDIWNTRAA